MVVTEPEPGAIVGPAHTGFSAEPEGLVGLHHVPWIEQLLGDPREVDVAGVAERVPHVDTAVLARVPQPAVAIHLAPSGVKPAVALPLLLGFGAEARLVRIAHVGATSVEAEELERVGRHQRFHDGTR
jgi:hypothetical protein